MRKIIVVEFLSLDGVIQAPGGPEEDTSGDFRYGGWVAPFSDDGTNAAMRRQMEPADLLLGRKTFDNFESYWPHHSEIWPGVNEVKKYVLSTTRTNSSWSNVEFLDNVEAIKKLRTGDGGDVKVWGSSELVQLLLQHDLVDEMWFKIYPIILGKGKKIYSDGILPAAFKLMECMSTPKGVIVAYYERAGKVQTGRIGE
jgi:dihydrofolate reductase